MSEPTPESLPSGQAVHADDPSEEFVFAAQLMHVDAAFPANFPAPHWMQPFPGAAAVPSVQLVQESSPTSDPCPAGQGAQNVEPIPAAYVLAAHDAHDACPSSDISPGSHKPQVSPPPDALPATHAVQILDPGTESEPGKQGVQSLEPEELANVF